MDLVAYSEEKFNAIKDDIENLSKKSDYKDQNLTFIPISALHGDNVVQKSDNITWYKGKSLLEHLGGLRSLENENVSEARFPVQTVIRPKTETHHDYRGYAGKLYGGDLAVGDQVTVLPTASKSKIKSITFFDKNYDKAKNGASFSLTLEDDVNISRGDMLAKTGQEPQMTKELNATICWMDKNTLNIPSKYYLKHGVNDVQAKIIQLDAIINTDFSGTNKDATKLVLNDIGKIKLKVSKPIFVDSYKSNKANGTFILIDPKTNNTSGVGFID